MSGGLAPGNGGATPACRLLGGHFLEGEGTVSEGRNGSEIEKTSYVRRNVCIYTLGARIRMRRVSALALANEKDSGSANS